MPSQDPYTALASVYDQPDHTEITRAFMARAQPAIDARPAGSWVLDLACGTGFAASVLLKQGVPVVGVDQSRPMLNIARKRCAGLGGRFVEGDLTTFSVRESCSVATACGDVMNHMPTVSLLRKVFRRAHDQLDAGGVLMFDALRRFCFEEYWTNQTYHLESDAGDLTMECDWDPRREIGTARMICYAKEKNGRFTKDETLLLEHYHSEETLRAALEHAGFAHVRADLWSPWDDQHLEPEMDRLFWTATKA